MMGAPRGGAMDNYSSWSNNDGRVMQSNPNMSNSLSKYYTVALCVCPSVYLSVCLSVWCICVCVLCMSVCMKCM